MRALLISRMFVLLQCAILLLLGFKDLEALWKQSHPLYGALVKCIIVNDSTLILGTDGRGIFISSNYGASWKLANTGLKNTKINCLVAKDSLLFTGTLGDGVYRSTDYGKTWAEHNTGLSNMYITSLAIHDSNLYAGTLGSGVFLSTMESSSWFPINTDLSNKEIYSLAMNGPYQYAGTCGFGVMGYFGKIPWREWCCRRKNGRNWKLTLAKPQLWRY